MEKVMRTGIAMGAAVGSFAITLLTIEVVTFFWSGTTSFYDTHPLLNAVCFATAALAGLGSATAVIASPGRRRDAVWRV